MIIVCPSCTTRYDIKAVLPPEGRSVRCAKCSTVWRALPEGSDESAPEPSVSPAPAESANNAQGSELDSEAGAEARFDQPEESYTQPFQETDGPSAEIYASPQTNDEGEPQLPEEERFEPDAPPPPLEGGSFASLEPPLLEDAPMKEPDRANGSSSLRWFGSFRRKGGKDGSNTASVPAPARSEAPIPFLRSDPIAVDRPELPISASEELALDEARQAIRRVFHGLGEGVTQTRASSTVRSQAPSPQEIEDNAPALMKAIAVQEEDRGGRAWVPSMLSRGYAQIEEEEKANASRTPQQGNGLGVDAGGFDASDGSKSVEDWTGRSQTFAENDSDFRQALSNYASSQAPDDLDDGAYSAAPGHDGRTLNVDLGSGALGLAGAREMAAAELDEAELARQLETELQTKAEKSGYSPSWRQSFPFTLRRPAGDGLEVSGPADEEPRDGAEGEASFDPRLYREIEEAQEHAGEPRRTQRGGLALAAAWGLLVCIASGLGVVFFSYRDIVAEALPGIAPLYRTLGMPVTAQPLIFESVQYEWTVLDDKPALIVTGSVFNRANRKVHVPDFFITVKDSDPSLDREYPVTLQTSEDKILPDEGAEFEIELVSPNASITAVELELRNVR
jgi:predicted Zn finger-like uncharacterized protein